MFLTGTVYADKSINEVISHTFNPNIENTYYPTSQTDNPQGYVICFYEPGTTSKPQDIKTLRFSKLAVKAKLKELGLWETITKTLNEDEYEDLLIADDFAFDNELFVRVYESLKPQIPNIDEILRQCIKK